MDRLVDDLARMSRAVQDGPHGDDDRVDVHLKPGNRVPVDDYAADDAIMDHDVLDAHGVEYRGAGLARPEYESRRKLDRVDRVVLAFVWPRLDVELVENLRRVGLHRHLVEKHAAAPRSAARRKLRLVDRHLVALEREVARGDESRRPRPDDRNVDRQVVRQLLEIPPDYRAGYDLFHHGIFRHCIVPFFLRGHYPVQVPAGIISAPGDLPAAPRLTANYTAKQSGNSSATSDWRFPNF